MIRKRTPYDLALWAALPMAHTSRIEGRLTMILDQNRNRRAMTRRVFMAALGVGAFVLVPLAMLRPVAWAQAAPPKDTSLRQTKRNAPSAAATHLRQVYGYLDIYRRTHGGMFPRTLASNSLVSDIAANPRRYGLPEQGPDNSKQALQLFNGPDNQRVIYFLHSRRPDGAFVGAAKRAGTRDVFAYTNYYVYNQARAGKMQTQGFYLVLWDDGTVQQIAADRILAVPAFDIISDRPMATEQARRQGEKQIAFPGQAGLRRS